MPKKQKLPHGYIHDIVQVKFTTPRFRGDMISAIGHIDGKTVHPWGGHPQPAVGETWECRVLTEWETGSANKNISWNAGMLVAPVRRID